MEDRNANILHVHTILQTKTKVSNAQALMVHYHSTRELLLDLKQQEKVLQKLWPFKLIQGENSSGYKTLIYTFFKITN